jgi:DNA mismatch repair protein MutH
MMGRRREAARLRFKIRSVRALAAATGGRRGEAVDGLPKGGPIGYPRHPLTSAACP